MSTILVLGGSNGRTLEKLAKKRDCQVIFHNGQRRESILTKVTNSYYTER